MPFPQPFCRSLATTHTCAYLGILNITHSEAEKASRRHARLAPAAALSKPSRKRNRESHVRGARRCKLSTGSGSPRELLGAKAEDPKHRRRRGKHGEVFPERGVGVGERVWSGAGWVTHTLELRSPQAQPEAQRDEVLSSFWENSQAPRTLQISTTNAVIDAFPKYFRDAFSSTPRWVTRQRRRRWQRGSLCFLTSARLIDVCNYFPNLYPHIPAPGSPLPRALQYAQPGPNCHVFIYPALRTLFLVAVLDPRAVPTTQQQPPHAEGKEAYGNASF